MLNEKFSLYDGQTAASVQSRKRWMIAIAKVIIPPIKTTTNTMIEVIVWTTVDTNLDTLRYTRSSNHLEAKKVRIEGYDIQLAWRILNVKTQG
jgi:predicted lipid carrier protein YhbT